MRGLLSAAILAASPAVAHAANSSLADRHAEAWLILAVGIVFLLLPMVVALARPIRATHRLIIVALDSAAVTIWITAGSCSANVAVLDVYIPVAGGCCGW